MPAVAGMYVGERVSIGEGAEPRTGNVLPLSKIPEGTPVSNIELRPNDGGKVARAAGASAIVYSAKGGSVVLKLPSGRLVSVSGESRATIGVVAGSGAVEKPLLKAGASYHKMRSRGRKWPRVRGVAMSIWYHPHGGGRHQKPGHPTSVSRNAPPGRKVGNIAPRKTGRGKVRKERVEVK
jgi:large subunit ribosomal protein L2